MKKSSVLLRRVVIVTFLSVPAISSAISMVHLVDLFNLGNPIWLSILLAITFELGSIASLLAISVIDKINTYAIWFIFFVLAGLQVLGNVYYSYTYTSVQLLANQNFLTTFNELFSFIVGDDVRDAKLFLSCVIGIPIPLIALFFLKSNMDYLKLNDDKQNEEGNIEEITHNDIETYPIEELGEFQDVISYDPNDTIDKEDIDLGVLEEDKSPDVPSYLGEVEEPRRRKTRVIGNAKIKY